MGGLIAGITQQTNLYVSGGAEFQGPVGGGSVCMVYSCESEEQESDPTISASTTNGAFVAPIGYRQT